MDLLRKDREWRDYPLGTKAHAITGGSWLRVERGWQWMGHTKHPGSTFPTPGADAFGECIELPPNAKVNRRRSAKRAGYQHWPIKWRSHGQCWRPR